MVRCAVGRSAVFVDYDFDDDLIDYTEHPREISRGGYVSGVLSSPGSLYGTNILRIPQISDISQIPSSTHRVVSYGRRPSHVETLFGDVDQQRRHQRPVFTRKAKGYGRSLSGPNHESHRDSCRGSCSQELRPRSSTSSARIVADNGWILQNMLLIHAAVIVLHTCLLFLHAALLIL
jgi:hypothetical protein